MMEGRLGRRFRLTGNGDEYHGEVVGERQPFEATLESDAIRSLDSLM